MGQVGLWQFLFPRSFVHDQNDDSETEGWDYLTIIPLYIMEWKLLPQSQQVSK